LDLTLDRHTHGDWAVVDVGGELDLYTAPSFRESVLEAAGDTDPPKVIVDFRGLGFIDSSGLGAIVACLKHLRERGGGPGARRTRWLGAPPAPGPHRLGSGAHGLHEHRRDPGELIGKPAVPSSRLHVARDPALALIVRIFVGSVAERSNILEAVRNDLRLAASELFSEAVEAGQEDPVTFEVSSGATGLELRAEGIRAPEVADTVGLDGWTGRFELIRALFPDAEVGETVRIRVPVPA
jgi:anti-anti-sigma factor